MLIGIDTIPCSLSLRDSSMFNYEMTSKRIALKNVIVQKSIFVDLLLSFNPNSYSALSPFIQQLLSKAIQNERESVFKKIKVRNRNGINP